MAGAGPRAPRRRSPAAAGLPRPLRLVPPLALMALIWALSAQHHLATDLGWVDTVLRKGAHMTEFAVLALLWTWALLDRTPAPGAVRGARAIVAGAAIAIGWAVVDELHQSTVDGRVGSPWDVAIDAAGVGIAVLLWRAWTVRPTRDRTG